RFSIELTAPPSLRGFLLSAQVPLDLEAICLKAMAKRPEDRYGSCRELADDLRRWMDDEPVRARRLGWPGRMSRWCKRNPGLAQRLGITAACLAVVAAVGTWMVVRQANSRARIAANFVQAESDRNAAAIKLN